MFWAVKHADGDTSYHVTNGDDLAAEGIDEGVEHIDTSRAPACGERWDWEAGAFCECPVLCSTMSASYAANLLPFVHARKAMEAHDWTHRGGEGGTWPMLCAEAEELDIPLSELVAAVLEHDATLIAGETARRAAKAASTGS